VNIELHIERLVLDGIDAPPGLSEPLREGVSAELTRLLRDGGLADTVMRRGEVARLSAPPAELSATGPNNLGRQLASAIYAGIGQ
jgi:hypothetical protein